MIMTPSQESGGRDAARRPIANATNRDCALSNVRYCGAASAGENPHFIIRNCGDGFPGSGLDFEDEISPGLAPPAHYCTMGTKSYSPIPCTTRNVADVSPGLRTTSSLGCWRKMRIVPAST